MEEQKKTTRGIKKENFNPLKKELVNVKLVRSTSSMYNDPNSPLDGGLSETSFITYAVPSRNGVIVNVLTPDEQTFFENYFISRKYFINIYFPIIFFMVFISCFC